MLRINFEQETADRYSDTSQNSIHKHMHFYYKYIYTHIHILYTYHKYIYTVLHVIQNTYSSNSFYSFIIHT